MHKSPASMRGALAAKSAAKKVDVVSVGCQTESAYNTNCSPAEPSLSQDMPDLNGMDPSSNAGDQRGTSSISPSTKDKQQTGTSENTSEGTIVMTIGKFSTLSDTMCSGPKRVQGVPWRIMVMPKQHVVQKKQQKCMGFFLQCCPEKVYSDAWSCKADAEMRLMSKKSGVTNFVRKTSHMYTSKENDWGYSCFMTWADVLDENQGYIKDDKITLEITVKAEPPKNLMSRDEFMKAIDQWYNLAEMQMTRGMIDLSLEANAQGLKFCKDKDEEMKAKLEEQKQRLVKKKVLDSISRIENHGGQPKTSEPLKPTSLRQALTGAQKTIVSKNGKAVANKRDRKTTLQQIKKKKQENAVKQDTQKKNESEGERSDISPAYWPSSPRYSTMSDTDAEDSHQSEYQTDFSLHTSSDAFNSKSYDTCCPAHGAVELSTDEDVDGDDEDDSDYYNEDEEAIENQLSDQEESLRGSTSSLDETLNYKVEIGCQTLFTGEEQTSQPQSQQQSQPQPNPRRERMHLIFTSHNTDDDDLVSECASTPEYQHPAGSPGSAPDEVASRFAEEIADENSDLFKKLAAGHSVTPEDHEKIDQWCIEHFGDVPKDLSACGLTIGLCAVTSRRCAEAGREFRKLISDTFKDEYKLAAKLLVENERQIARIRAVQAGISEVMQKHDIPPGDFQLDLADDAASGHKNPKKLCKENLQPEQDCAAFVEQIMGSDDYDNVLYPMSECEKSVEQLVKDMGQAKFDICIAEKLQNMLKLKDYNTGLVTLLTQLFNYFRTLTEQKYELQKSLDVARTLFQMKTKNGGLGFKTKQVQDSEKRIIESETLVKKIGHTYQQEVEKNKKLDAQLMEEQNKLKQCQQQLDQLTQQLKEARNLTKKAEKKAKQEETKNASLLADKLDLEDKLKAAKKEADQLKKKSTEDRNNAKKQKDRDLETIRRLETENAEKDADREREKGLFEEKLREARTKENKAERERKQAVGNTNVVLERARAAESSQIALMYELCQHRFEKVQEEIHVGMSEAEKSFKRAHNTQADQDIMKKNLAEWKAVSEELDKIMKETKIEYDNAADVVKKGQVLLSHLELSQPTLPTLPKTIRLPPVQVVQPSTSIIPPPTIVTPPAGVIGQPRSSTSSVGVIGQPSSRSQVAGPPGMNGTISAPSYSSMKMGHGDSGPGQSHVQPQAAAINPASSLWNWSSPLENVTASVFRSSSMEHTRPQQSSLGMDSWTHHPDDFTAQALNRTMYNSHNQQSQSVNWANAPGWQRPSSANITQQSQYGRSGLPPYYQ